MYIYIYNRMVRESIVCAEIFHAVYNERNPV